MELMICVKDYYKPDKTMYVSTIPMGEKVWVALDMSYYSVFQDSLWILRRMDGDELPIPGSDMMEYFDSLDEWREKQLDKLI
jgi:hypothetical protein